jgi:hypothetical protein
MTRRRSTKEIDLGFPYEEQPYKPRVQIITSTRDDPKRPEPQREVICPTCGNNERMGYTIAGMWFHQKCLTTINKLVDAVPGPNEEVNLGEQTAEPFFKSIDRRKPLEGLEDLESTQFTHISGNGRKLHIKTTNLAEALSEDWIRKQLQEDAAYAY